MAADFYLEYLYKPLIFSCHNGSGKRETETGTKTDASSSEAFIARGPFH